jgi:beta-phosphoglucomutase-like phosphatase (HAD superfamily)
MIEMGRLEQLAMDTLKELRPLDKSPIPQPPINNLSPAGIRELAFHLAEEGEAFEKYIKEQKEVNRIYETVDELRDPVRLRDEAEKLRLALTDIHRKARTLKQSIQLQDVLKKEYQTRVLHQAEFNDYDSFSDAITKINREIDRISTSHLYMGKFIHRKKIEEKKRDKERLDKVQHDYWLDFPWAGFFQDDTDRISEFVNQRIVYDIMAMYDEMVNIPVEEVEISPEVLERIMEEYTLATFDRSIQENHRYELGTTDDLIAQARELFKQKLNMPEKPNYTEEEKVRKEKLDKSIEDLPFWISRTFPTISNQEFNEQIKQILGRAASYKSREEKREGLLSYERILDAAITGNLSHWVSRQASDKRASVSARRQDLEIKDTIDFDTTLLQVLRDSETTQDLLGERMTDYYEVMGEKVWTRVINNPPKRNDMSLARKAAEMNISKYTPHMFMHFWREPGHSGEFPFIRPVEGTRYGQTVKFANSLSKDKIREFEHIPGFKDLVTLIKQHPDKFFTSVEYLPDNTHKDNPINVKVVDALGRMCSHYMQNGTAGEQYFALGTLLQMADKGSRPLGVLLDNLSVNLDIDRDFLEPNGGHIRNILTEAARRHYLRKEDLGKLVGELTDYSKERDEFLKSSKTAATRDIIRSLEQEILPLLYTDDYHALSFEEGKKRAFQFLEDFESDEVQAALNDEDYGKFFRERVNDLSSNITEVDRDLKGIVEDYQQMVQDSSEVIANSSQESSLLEENLRLLEGAENFARSLKESPGEFFKIYLQALDQESILQSFKTRSSKDSIDSWAQTIYRCDKDLVAPMVREAIRSNMDNDRLSRLRDYLYVFRSSVHSENSLDFSKLVEYSREGSAQVLGVLEDLSRMGKGSWDLLRKVQQGDLDLNSILRSRAALEKHGIIMTSYLVSTLAGEEDKTGLVKEWKATIESFAEGNFDVENELHRNLEYTRFKSIVEHKKVRKHVKNHFTFDDYLGIFRKNAPKHHFSEQDKFEIECVVEEAKLLKGYISAVKARADALGREVIVIPNLSYGYVPTAPLVRELRQEGIETIIGVKIGSTESHNNKEVVNHRLFKGHRKHIANKRPIIVVVDGTQHLVARDAKNKDARYPDAYQGYLNQVIALNDALGFDGEFTTDDPDSADETYGPVGKSQRDMQNLRNSSEFQELVRTYRSVAKPKNITGKKIVFDLDNTLIGKEDQTRPHAKELLEKLLNDGNEIVIWTYAKREDGMKKIGRSGLAKYFSQIIVREDYASPELGQDTLKDIRVVAGDILVDNRKFNVEQARNAGIKAVKVSSYTRGDSHALEGLYDSISQAVNGDLPYQFGLWNTAGKELIIRNYHKKIDAVAPTNPEEIEGPAMIFCNVGLLDEQISPELKKKHPGLKHTPAYFDDSGKIINFDFGFDNFGVRYLNTLETEIKRAYGAGQGIDADTVSSLIRYIRTHDARPAEEVA